jgi:hypothetical protein
MIAIALATNSTVNAQGEAVEATAVRMVAATCSAQ